MWWTSNASSVLHSFQNKVMLPLKIMLIYDEPLLNRQPPLSRHLPVPQGLPALNGDATTNIKYQISISELFIFFLCVTLSKFHRMFPLQKRTGRGKFAALSEEIDGKKT